MKPHTVYWHRLIITLVVVTVLFAVGWSRLDIETDVVSFLPQGDSIVADALYILKNHPIQDQLIIDVSLQKKNSDLLVECGRRVEQHLRQSKLFKKVGLQDFQSLIPDLVFHILNHLPLLFSSEDLQNKIEPLLNPQKVRNKISDTQLSLFNLEGIGQTEFISKDPLGFKDIVMARLAHLAPTPSVRIYKGQLISEDGRHLLVIADSAVSSTDTAYARQVADLIDTIAAYLDHTYPQSGQKVTLTPMGAYRFALDNELIVRKDVRNAILLATLGIILLLIFTFPRPYLGLLSLLPAIAGAMMAFFVFSLIHDSVSLMVLGFGGAIISISVDHGIAYLLFLDRPYRTFGKDASKEVRAVGLMAALTTIGAFTALNFSGFPILEQLGQFTALGIAFSFIFVHTAFPMIFPEMPAAQSRRMPLQYLVDKLAGMGRKGALAALIFAVVMLCFAKPDFNVSLSAMNTVSKETQTAEEMISRVWGQVFNKIYLMTEGKTLHELQTKGDRLTDILTHEQQSGALSSGFVASMVFPGLDGQQKNFAAWKIFWNRHRVAVLEKSIQEAASEFGFTANAFGPFFKMLKINSYDPASMVIPEKYYELLGISIDPEKKTWLQISTLTTGKEYRAEAFLAEYAELGRFFDPNFFSQKLGQLLFVTFTKMLIIVGLSVTILLLLYFLDLPLTIISLLPVAFALVSTLGTLKLIGHPLDLPALMLAIIVIGMGIDYSLFFVRSYQRYGKVTHPYFGLIRTTVFLAGTSTIIGFGVLSLAQHSLLRSAGITLLFGVGYALVGAFIILPPLLKYRLRTRAEDGCKNGSIRSRVLWRYRVLEAYPRLFARYKMHFDPMFTELPHFLDSSKDVQTIMDIGCGYGVQTSWLLERFPGARVVGIDPDAGRVRVAARAAGRRASIKTGSAPDIPVVSQQADLVIMLDIVHYLNDEALQQTIKNLRGRLKIHGRLIIRASIPPTRRTPWLWWLENFKLRLNRTPSCYRSVKTLQTMLVENGYRVDQTQPSGDSGELVWLISTKNV